MTSLGSTFCTHLEQAPVYYTTAKIFGYQAYYPSILYGTAEYLYQLAMTYRVKEALKVEVDYVFIAFSHCLLRS